MNKNRDPVCKPGQRHEWNKTRKAEKRGKLPEQYSIQDLSLKSEENRRFQKEPAWPPPTVSSGNSPKNSEELCSLRTTCRKGQEEVPCRCLLTGVCVLLSHSVLTSDTGRVPADDASCCHQQGYSPKQPDDLRSSPLPPRPHWKPLEIRHFEKTSLSKIPFNLLNYSCFWKLYLC